MQHGYPEMDARNIRCNFIVLINCIQYRWDGEAIRLEQFGKEGQKTAHIKDDELLDAN